MNNNTKEQLNGKKILIATVAGDGHFNPLTGLAKFLIASGCDVRWFTSESNSDKLKKLKIPHFPFRYGLDVNLSNLDILFPERKLITDAGERASFDMINFFIKPGPDLFRDIEDIQATFPFDAVIVESMFPANPYIGVKLGVPVLSIGIIPLAAESRDLGPYGPGFYPPANKQEREKLNDLREIFKNQVYKESTDTLVSLLVKHNIPHERSNIFDVMINSPDLYLQIGSPSFEYPRTDLGANIRFIGSLLPYSNPKQTAEWFDERVDAFKEIILVTQGTVEGDPAKLLIPTLEAFKDSDTLVIATTGGKQTKELREKYPFHNILIEDYIPFNQVMPHATVYVTNGGYSGTLLAIKYCLPMVAAGLFEGKAETCSRIGHFQYGIDLKTETPDPQAIREAVESINKNMIYKLNVTRLSKEMDAFDAKELCAGYLAELIEKKR